MSAQKPAALTLSLFNYSFISRGWPTWVRYLVAALIVLATLGVRLALGQELAGSPFLLFFFAVIVSAAMFDHGSGIFAVLLSAGLAKWFLIEPIGTLNVNDTSDIVGLACFISIGLVTTAILEALHRVASDLSQANEKLIASEREKDLLLEEASHRFKNELAMLAAVLRLQQRMLENPAAVSALKSMADRVQVLARLHERLQRAHGGVVVDTREFLDELCQDLRSALTELRPITLRANIEQHFLPEERAVPVGLVLNELVTNALKYAFPDDRTGTVSVVFARDRDLFHLTVSDDGIGFSHADASPTNHPGLGQRLVKSMVAQLEGCYELERGSDGRGTVVNVSFPAKP